MMPKLARDMKKRHQAHGEKFNEYVRRLLHSGLAHVDCCKMILGSFDDCSSRVDSCRRNFENTSRKEKKRKEKKITVKEGVNKERDGPADRLVEEVAGCEAHPSVVEPDTRDQNQNEEKKAKVDTKNQNARENEIRA